MVHPVARMWLANPALSIRGAAGGLVLAGKKLRRSDVIINGPVVGPALKHLGARVSVGMYASVVEDFFLLARPRGKSVISGS